MRRDSNQCRAIANMPRQVIRVENIVRRRGKTLRLRCCKCAASRRAGLIAGSAPR